ncbi:ATP-dependent nuclease [Streptomyces sp. NPDC003660]
MTSTWSQSAPSTAFASSARRAKSADRMLGLICAAMDQACHAPPGGAGSGQRVVQVVRQSRPGEWAVSQFPATTSAPYAVKELNEDLKNSSTATFGRLLSILFEDIEHQLPQLEASFDRLRSQLNVVSEQDGSEKDGRLAEVREVESLIQRNLQESFPRARVRLEIPPPRLRSLLEEAHITVNDGISGPFKTKGDGLRRSVAFALLRAYVDLKTAKPTRPDSSQQPNLLLFEEPEVFLHPQAQRKLFEALTIFSEYNDVLVSTHSSAFCAPGATGTFVKVVKDHTLEPPASRTCVIDLSDMDARDQFEIITHENNDAAFFATSVLLVEGPSDRTLCPQWDFDKHGTRSPRSKARAALSGTATSSDASRCEFR